MGTTRLISIPRNRAWRFLFSALVVSSIGDQFTRIALFARVSAEHGGAMALTVVAIAQAVGSLISAPIGGVLADRGHGRRLLMSLDATRAAGLVGVAFSSGIAPVVVIAAVLAACSGAYTSIEGALEARLIPDESDLALANSARGAAFKLVAAVGPALAGMTIAAVGSRSAFLVDAVTFVAAIGLVLGIGRRLEVPTHRLPSAGKQGGFGEYRAGLRTIIKVSELRMVLIAFGVIVLIVGFQGPALFALVDSRFDEGARMFGLCMATLSAGSFIGAIVLGKRPTLIQRGATIVYGAMIVDSIALVGFVWSDWPAINLVAMFVMGGISAVAVVVIRFTVQARAPRDATGRALSLLDLVSRPMEFVSLGLFSLFLVVVSNRMILFGSAVVELVVGVTGVAIASRAAGSIGSTTAEHRVRSRRRAR